MTDLVAFLRARLDEDEATARAASPGLGWARGFIQGADEDIDIAADEAHIVRHHPARVLREVEAKRAILELHKGEPSIHAVPPGSGPLYCMSDGVDDGWYNVEWPCATVRAVAAVYRDHPDYDEVWKP